MMYGNTPLHRYSVVGQLRCVANVGAGLRGLLAMFLTHSQRAVNIDALRIARSVLALFFCSGGGGL
jgi:hypothetical protein